MNVTYSGFGSKNKSEVESSVFLLGNGKGGYYLHDPDSHYGGFTLGLHPQLKICNAFPFTGEITLGPHWAMIGEVSLVVYGNSLIIQSPKEFPLLLDIRKPYNRDTLGKQYSTEKAFNSTIIHYSKKEKYEISLAINQEITETGKWVKVTYAKDKERGDKETDYVYELGIIPAGKTIITIGKNPKRTLFRNNTVSQERIKITKGELVKQALLDLWSGEHFLAGYPWFFQNWSRDELISMKGIILADEKEKAKSRLLYWLHAIDNQGLLPNNDAGSTLISADSIGWLFLRIKENLKLFDAKEKKKITSQLKEVIERQLEHHTKNGLAVHKPFSTWMDTSPTHDGRDGARIEIQTLRLSMYQFMYTLSKEKRYKDLEKELKQKVRETFFREGYLYDGDGDATKRPNAFLAAYIYPDLLTKQEWRTCFSHLLDALWLDWGGVATIDKHHPLFKNSHTGMDNKSYHHGDSWFWINNITAIVLERSGWFEEYVQAIHRASTAELLQKGALGCSAELSDAKELCSKGCPSQLWSAATYMELLNELKYI